MKKIILSFMIIVSIAVIYGALNDKSVNAVKGTVNLNGYDFEKNGNVKIKGQLELYNNQLLKPDDLKLQKPDKYLTILDSLKSQLNGKNTGYMTLHLRIFATDGVTYGIRMQELLSASKIWVNGVLQEQVGKVGTSYKDEKAIYLPIYMYFTPKNGVVDIVMQTSNYRTFFASVKPIEFGLKDKIMNTSMLNLSLDLMIVGALFIIETLFLVLRKSFENGRLCVYFWIICFLIQIRCLFFNERLIVRFFPNMPFELLSKTAALTYYILVLVYVLFLKEMFFDFPKLIVKVAMFFCSIFCGICIITNNTFYDRLTFPNQLILGVILFGVLAFLIKSVRAKEKNSDVMFWAFVFLMVTVLNDVLVNNGVLNTRYGAQIGMFNFVFLQTYVIIIKYSDEIIISEKIKLENKIIYEKSIRDNLTNLYNRNYIEQVLDDAMDNYMNHGEIFTLLMFDIDYFKSINDTYGHLQGDYVLSTVSNIIMRSVREIDYVGRFGGEEFIVILINTKQEEAREVAERIRKNINYFQWENGIKVTISGGLYENHIYVKEQCIKNADEKLYKAKKNGRNQIVY